MLPEQFLELVRVGDLVGAVKLAPRAYGEWWMNLVQNDPWHVVVETLLVVFIVYLVFFQRKHKKSRDRLSEKEVDELIEEWTPEPLVPDLTPEDEKFLASVPVIEKYEGKYVTLEGDSSRKLNLIPFDFLGLSQRKEMHDNATATLKEYGCGSCGPRGFYGSVMPHVNIENQIAEFLGTEGGISYSDTASTVSSAIPAFAKRGDLIIVDEKIHEALQVGVELSRAWVKTFAHNDMTDLERVLKEVQKEDRRVGRDVTKQRRFIVSEGLFRNTGTICDLKNLVKLKKSYGFRLILDESYSFGSLGDKGKGVTELLGVDVLDVDILMISMAFSLASVGGMCLGNVEVVDHQRLSGAGYCFSASAPPFTSTAAGEALRLMQTEPQLTQSLKANTKALVEGISQIPQLKVVSDNRSPIVFVSLKQEAQTYDEQAEILAGIVEQCRTASNVLLTQTKTLKGEKNRLSQKPEKDGKVPFLRIAVRASLKKDDIQCILSALRMACVKL